MARDRDVARPGDEVRAALQRLDRSIREQFDELRREFKADLARTRLVIIASVFGAAGIILAFIRLWL